LACGAEPGAAIPATRRFLEEVWHADAYNVTGLSDVFGWHGAECEYKMGMHYGGSDFCLFQLIDPDTGKILDLKDGTEGEIVYTMIDREASPLLRFRSHDYAVVWTSKCNCGRTTLRFEIKGRNDDMLIVKGINVFPSAIEDVLKGFIPEVTGEFQLLLDQPSPLPKIRIRLEYGEGFEKSKLPDLRQKIEKRMREILLFKSDIELIPPMTIPRVEYKPKRIYKLYEGEKP
ncbi:MAG: phenylacetate--CoA ligase family protein, partial [Armatimonadetes bacterium]|nr:phenylacetate--CoA ligase family protein [Armatimonadota bacterium]